MDRTAAPQALVAARLLAVEGSVLALGAGAHVVGGGAMRSPAGPSPAGWSPVGPSPAVVLLVVVLVLPVAAVVARRPLTVPVLLPVAVAAQVGVHVALTWLGSGAGGAAGAVSAAGAAGTAGAAAAGAAPEAHLGRGTAGAHAPEASAGVAPGADDTMRALGGAAHGVGELTHGLADGLPMLLAHVAAMVVTVLLLVATERGLLALAHGWAAVLPALLGAPAVRVVRRPLPVPSGSVLRPRVAVLRSGVGRRGPPAGVLPATAA